MVTDRRAWHGLRTFVPMGNENTEDEVIQTKYKQLYTRKCHFIVHTVKAINLHSKRACLRKNKEKFEKIKTCRDIFQL